jgi:hypothetical protein
MPPTLSSRLLFSWATYSSVRPRAAGSRRTRLQPNSPRQKKAFIFLYNKSKGPSMLARSPIWSGGHAEIDVPKRDSES